MDWRSWLLKKKNKNTKQDDYSIRIDVNRDFSTGQKAELLALVPADNSLLIDLVDDDPERSYSEMLEMFLDLFHTKDKDFFMHEFQRALACVVRCSSNRKDADRIQTVSREKDTNKLLHGLYALYDEKLCTHSLLALCVYLLCRFLELDQKHVDEPGELIALAILDYLSAHPCQSSIWARTDTDRHSIMVVHLGSGAVLIGLVTSTATTPTLCLLQPQTKQKNGTTTTTTTLVNDEPTFQIKQALIIFSRADLCEQDRRIVLTQNVCIQTPPPPHPHTAKALRVAFILEGIQAQSEHKSNNTAPTTLKARFIRGLAHVLDDLSVCNRN